MMSSMEGRWWIGLAKLTTSSKLAWHHSGEDAVLAGVGAGAQCGISLSGGLSTRACTAQYITAPGPSIPDSQATATTPGYTWHRWHHHTVRLDFHGRCKVQFALRPGVPTPTLQ